MSRQSSLTSGAYPDEPAVRPGGHDPLGEANGVGAADPVSHLDGRGGRPDPSVAEPLSADAFGAELLPTDGAEPLSADAFRPPPGRAKPRTLSPASNAGSDTRSHAGSTPGSRPASSTTGSSGLGSSGLGSSGLGSSGMGSSGMGSSGMGSSGLGSSGLGSSGLGSSGMGSSGMGSSGMGSSGLGSSGMGSSGLGPDVGFRPSPTVPTAPVRIESRGSAAPPSQPAEGMRRPSAQAPRTPSRLHIPTRVGPYEVMGEIGSGGMAFVYKARQPALDRMVAIKMLRPEFVHEPQISTRFEREATALATLRHGNIVHVYDFVQEGDRAYIVMEYVDGIDLFELIADRQRVPPEVAALIARGIAEGLEHAHNRGLVHRDIKPSNVLLSKKGEVKVMDFGIARDPDKHEITRVGLAVGTPAYMAPEQIRVESVDARTDVFALGIVLYELLAGDKPWADDGGRSVTSAILDLPMRPLSIMAPDVPGTLAAIVRKCLKKDPSDRYPSMFELMTDLDAYIRKNTTADPRSRLLLYLWNRKKISQEELENTLPKDLLERGGVRRRDAGLSPLPTQDLLRPVVWAHAATLGAVVLAAALAAPESFTARQLRRQRVVLAPGSAVAETMVAAAPRPSLEPDSVLQADRATERRVGPPADSRVEPIGTAIGAPVETQVEGSGSETPASQEPPPASEPVAADPAVEAAQEPSPSSSESMVVGTGYLQVVVKPWADVSVDHEFVDTTPFGRKVPLKPGRHVVSLRNPNYKPQDRLIEVKPGEVVRLQVELEAL